MDMSHEASWVTKLRTERKEMIKVQGVIPFVDQMGDLGVQIWVRIVQNLPVNELLGETNMDKGIQCLFPMEREIVHVHSAPVALIGKIQRAA